MILAEAEMEIAEMNESHETMLPVGQCTTRARRCTSRARIGGENAIGVTPCNITI